MKCVYAAVFTREANESYGKFKARCVLASSQHAAKFLLLQRMRGEQNGMMGSTVDGKVKVDIDLDQEVDRACIRVWEKEREDG